MLVTSCLVTIVIFLFGYKFWKWLWKGYDYFEKQGIPFIKPYPGLGSLWGLAPKTKTIRDFTIENYNLFPNETLIGMFDQTRIVYILRDPELIKQAGIKEFDHFVGM